MKKIILAALLAFIAALGFYSPSFAQQTNVRVVNACGALAPYGAIGSGKPYSMTMDTNGNLCTAASVSASISGFTATSTGTPISVTTASTTGTLPAGAVVVATNVGSTNGAYCALGGTATTSNQYLSPGGGWFAFTVGASTQLSCITSTGTTTVNMTGGAGLPTGTGGGGGAGGSLTWPGSAGTGTLGAAGSGTAPYVNAYVIGANSNGLAAASGSSPVVQAKASHASTTALAAALSVSGSAANLLAYNCTAVTGGAAGFCVAYNSATTPGTGALTGSLVLDFCYFDTTARGCSLTRAGSPVAYSAGVQILVTSAASPYTYTTGTDTAAISADYQ